MSTAEPPTTTATSKIHRVPDVREDLGGHVVDDESVQGACDTGDASADGEGQGAKSSPG